MFFFFHEHASYQSFDGWSEEGYHRSPVLVEGDAYTMSSENSFNVRTVQQGRTSTKDQATNEASS